MRRFFAAAFFAVALWFAGTMPAASQSSPGLVYGQVPTAAQWNSYLAAKQDVLGYTPVNRAGDTMVGKLTTAASNTSAAGLNLPHGTAPTTPVNGDMWTTTSGLYVRINGSTIGPVTAGGITALTGDVTATGPGSAAATIASIQGTAVSGTTGTGNVVFSTAPTITSVLLGGNAILTSDGANIVAQRNGATAQQLNVYNTYTNASNGEWLQLVWGGGAVEITSAANGTGTVRPMYVGTKGSAALSFATGNVLRWNVSATGHLLAVTDNSYDIGAAGATRPRNVYVSGLGVFGGTLTASSTITGTPGANTAAITVTGFSLTGSNAQSLIDLAGTLNTSGSPDVFAMRVTDTARGASTKLLNIYAGSGGATSMFSVDRLGQVTSDWLVTGTALNGKIVLSTNNNEQFVFAPAGDVSGLAVKQTPNFIVGLGEGVSTPTVRWNSTTYSTSSAISIDGAAQTLAMRNSTLAQSWRVYKTWTDASNYERGVMDWAITSDVFTVGTAAAGSGTQRQMNLASAGLGVNITGLALTAGAVGMGKMTASGSAPGATGAKFEVVCGTNAGTLKMIMYGGTSSTPSTVVDNVGASATGC